MFNADEDQEVGKFAIRLANAVILPMVLKSALELNVIDTIFAAGDGAFLSPSEIAGTSPVFNKVVIFYELLFLRLDERVPEKEKRGGVGDPLSVVIRFKHEHARAVTHERF
ncbi:hypothetical protein CCACVL1_01893 [Corchorus capsularis]|uniref:O-methyltransferase dimerisation domain-containing protein n=1 Tax=Corchorus capsularis TaxID=210143 RepID=A0A1R3KED7_COCAP|nr:hypothetical protein CCACVL1_01893 [Corchorus capsularis]